MIIWINGAFGVGKSLIADELKKSLENCFVYDPEQVGYFLWDNFPENMKRNGDFQNIEMWRNFNYQILKYINENYSGILIVPMTINNKEYFDEIITKLKDNNLDVKHYILMAKKETIVDRLKNRGGDTVWAEEQIDKCLKAFNNQITETKIFTDNKKAEEIVLEIINKSGIILK